MGATRYATRSTTQSVSGFFISPHQPKCPFVYFASASQTNSLRVKDTHIPLHQQNKKKVPDGVPVPANSNRRSVDQMGRHGHAQGKIIFFFCCSLPQLKPPDDSSEEFGEHFNGSREWEERRAAAPDVVGRLFLSLAGWRRSASVGGWLPVPVAALECASAGYPTFESLTISAMTNQRKNKNHTLLFFGVGFSSATRRRIYRKSGRCSHVYHQQALTLSLSLRFNHMSALRLWIKSAHLGEGGHLLAGCSAQRHSAVLATYSATGMGSKSDIFIAFASQCSPYSLAELKCLRPIINPNSCHMTHLVTWAAHQIDCGPSDGICGQSDEFFFQPMALSCRWPHPWISGQMVGIPTATPTPFGPDFGTGPLDHISTCGCGQ